jgi:hypothetical protein
LRGQSRIFFSFDGISIRLLGVFLLRGTLH